MKKTFLFILILSLFVFSCGTKDIVEEETEELPVVEEIVSENIVSDITDDSSIQLFVDEEPDIVSVAEEDPVTSYFTDVDLQEEYFRSISKLTDDGLDIISPEVFEEDKDQIFIIIEDLATIMKKKNYNAWVNYLTPESKEYWSDRHNLLELSMVLFPNGDYRLNNLKEYFENFFILARKGRVVDEIRYVTPDYVKVVQYKNNTDIIYYFFEKQNGEWKLRLDTL